MVFFICIHLNGKNTLAADKNPDNKRKKTNKTTTSKSSTESSDASPETKIKRFAKKTTSKKRKKETLSIESSTESSNAAASSRKKRQRLEGNIDSSTNATGSKKPKKHKDKRHKLRPWHRAVRERAEQQRLKQQKEQKSKSQNVCQKINSSSEEGETSQVSQGPHSSKTTSDKEQNVSSEISSNEKKFIRRKDRHFKHMRQLEERRIKMHEDLEKKKKEAQKESRTVKIKGFLLKYIEGKGGISGLKSQLSQNRDVINRSMSNRAQRVYERSLERGAVSSLGNIVMQRTRNQRFHQQNDDEAGPSGTQQNQAIPSTSMSLFQRLLHDRNRIILQNTGSSELSSLQEEEERRRQEARQSRLERIRKEEEERREREQREDEEEAAVASVEIAEENRLSQKTTLLQKELLLAEKVYRKFGQQAALSTTVHNFFTSPSAGEIAGQEATANNQSEVSSSASESSSENFAIITNNKKNEASSSESFVSIDFEPYTSNTEEERTENVPEESRLQDVVTSDESSELEETGTGRTRYFSLRYKDNPEPPRNNAPPPPLSSDSDSSDEEPQAKRQRIEKESASSSSPFTSGSDSSSDEEKLLRRVRRHAIRTGDEGPSNLIEQRLANPNIDIEIQKKKEEEERRMERRQEEELREAALEQAYEETIRQREVALRLEESTLPFSSSVQEKRGKILCAELSKALSNFLLFNKIYMRKDKMVTILENRLNNRRKAEERKLVQPILRNIEQSIERCRNQSLNTQAQQGENSAQATRTERTQATRTERTQATRTERAQATRTEGAQATRTEEQRTECSDIQLNRYIQDIFDNEIQVVPPLHDPTGRQEEESNRKQERMRKQKIFLLNKAHKTFGENRNTFKASAAAIQQQTLSEAEKQERLRAIRKLELSALFRQHHAELLRMLIEIDILNLQKNIISRYLNQEYGLFFTTIRYLADSPDDVRNNSVDDERPNEQNNEDNNASNEETTVASTSAHSRAVALFINTNIDNTSNEDTSSTDTASIISTSESEESEEEGVVINNQRLFNLNFAPYDQPSGRIRSRVHAATHSLCTIYNRDGSVTEQTETSEELQPNSVFSPNLLRYTRPANKKEKKGEVKKSSDEQATTSSSEQAASTQRTSTASADEAAASSTAEAVSPFYEEPGENGVTSTIQHVTHYEEGPEPPGNTAPPPGKPESSDSEEDKSKEQPKKKTQKIKRPSSDTDEDGRSSHKKQHIEPTQQTQSIETTSGLLMSLDMPCEAGDEGPSKKQDWLQEQQKEQRSREALAIRWREDQQKTQEEEEEKQQARRLAESIREERLEQRERESLRQRERESREAEMLEPFSPRAQKIRARYIRNSVYNFFQKNLQFKSELSELDQKIDALNSQKDPSVSTGKAIQEMYPNFLAFYERVRSQTQMSETQPTVEAELKEQLQDQSITSFETEDVARSRIEMLRGGELFLEDLQKRLNETLQQRVQLAQSTTLSPEERTLRVLNLMAVGRHLQQQQRNAQAAILSIRVNLLILKRIELTNKRLAAERKFAPFLYYAKNQANRLTFLPLEAESSDSEAEEAAMPQEENQSAATVEAQVEAADEAQVAAEPTPPIAPQAEQEAFYEEPGENGVTSTIQHVTHYEEGPEPPGNTASPPGKPESSESEEDKPKEQPKKKTQKTKRPSSDTDEEGASSHPTQQTQSIETTTGLLMSLDMSCEAGDEGPSKKQDWLQEQQKEQRSREALAVRWREDQQKTQEEEEEKQKARRLAESIREERLEQRERESLRQRERERREAEMLEPFSPRTERRRAKHIRQKLYDFFQKDVQFKLEINKIEQKIADLNSQVDPSVSIDKAIQEMYPNFLLFYEITQRQTQTSGTQSRLQAEASTRLETRSVNFRLNALQGGELFLEDLQKRLAETLQQRVELEQSTTLSPEEQTLRIHNLLAIERDLQQQQRNAQATVISIRKNRLTLNKTELTNQRVAAQRAFAPFLHYAKNQANRLTFLPLEAESSDSEAEEAAMPQEENQSAATVEAQVEAADEAQAAAEPTPPIAPQAEQEAFYEEPGENGVTSTIQHVIHYEEGPEPPGNRAPPPGKPESSESEEDKPKEQPKKKTQKTKRPSSDTDEEGASSHPTQQTQSIETTTGLLMSLDMSCEAGDEGPSRKQDWLQEQQKEQNRREALATSWREDQQKRQEEEEEEQKARRLAESIREERLEQRERESLRQRERESREAEMLEPFSPRTERRRAKYIRQKLYDFFQKDIEFKLEINKIEQKIADLNSQIDKSVAIDKAMQAMYPKFLLFYELTQSQTQTSGTQSRLQAEASTGLEPRDVTNLRLKSLQGGELFLEDLQKRLAETLQQRVELEQSTTLSPEEQTLRIHNLLAIERDLQQQQRNAQATVISIRKNRLMLKRIELTNQRVAAQRAFAPVMEYINNYREIFVPLPLPLPLEAESSDSEAEEAAMPQEENQSAATVEAQVEAADEAQAAAEPTPPIAPQAEQEAFYEEPGENGVTSTIQHVTHYEEGPEPPGNTAPPPIEDIYLVINNDNEKSDGKLLDNLDEDEDLGLVALFDEESQTEEPQSDKQSTNIIQRKKRISKKGMHVPGILLGYNKASQECSLKSLQHGLSVQTSQINTSMTCLVSQAKVGLPQQNSEEPIQTNYKYITAALKNKSIFSLPKNFLQQAIQTTLPNKRPSRMFASMSGPKSAIQFQPSSAQFGLIINPVSKIRFGLAYSYEKDALKKQPGISFNDTVGYAKVGSTNNVISGIISWNNNDPGTNILMVASKGWGKAKHQRYFSQNNDIIKAKGIPTTQSSGLLLQLGYTLPLTPLVFTPNTIIQAASITPYIKTLFISSTIKQYTEKNTLFSSKIVQTHSRNIENTIGVQSQFILYDTYEFQLWTAIIRGQTRNASLHAHSIGDDKPEFMTCIPQKKERYIQGELGASFNMYITKVLGFGITGSVQTKASKALDKKNVHVRLWYDF